MTIKEKIFWFFVAVALLAVVAFVYARFGSVPFTKHAPGVTDADWQHGGGTTVVVIYSDFSCEECVRYYGILRWLFDEAAFKGKVTWVYRHFIDFHNERAVFAARAAEAAGKQGKFWEMYAKLYESRFRWIQHQNPEALMLDMAAEIGLNLDQFRTDFASEEVASAFANDRAGGEGAGVVEAPTFFLNGKKLVRPENYEEFVSIVRGAL